MTKGYDPEVEKLARYFLASEAGITEDTIRELAGVIQGAIEDWWSELPEYKPEPDPPDREEQQP